MLDPKRAWIRQLIAFGVLLAVWQAAGNAGMLNPLYMPTPLQIWGALVELFAYRRHHRALRDMGRPGLNCVVTSTGDRIRFDTAHPHPTSATSKPNIPVERRDS